MYFSPQEQLRDFNAVASFMTLHVSYTVWEQRVWKRTTPQISKLVYHPNAPTTPETFCACSDTGVPRQVLRGRRRGVDQQGPVRARVAAALQGVGAETAASILWLPDCGCRKSLYR